MCGYQPKFSVSVRSINLISEISSLVTELGHASLSRDLHLRRKNRVKSIQSSLQIEANSLTLEQVSAIFDGKRVVGPQKDIKEVANAIRAYDMIPRLDPYSKEDMLKLHGVMMDGLTEQSGMFRTVGVNVVNSRTGEVIHYAPDPSFVPRFIDELMEWASSAEDHPLIVSCVFHHEFEYIHPFTDGNGRTGRLWQNLILSKWDPIFEWIPIESVIRDRQSDYYRCIREATDNNDTSVFIEFILEAIRDVLADLAGKRTSGHEESVLEMISDGSYINAVDAAERLGVSERTIRRALAMLKDKGAIRREGSDKNGRWIIDRKG